MVLIIVKIWFDFCFATGEIVRRRRRLAFGRAGGGGREVGRREVGGE